MFKVFILFLAVATIVNSLTFLQFNNLLEHCHDSTILSCKYEPFQDNPIKDDELLCAQDYYKSNLCLLNYKQCLLSDTVGLDSEVSLL